MIVPVILAGGSGTRLWPLSREFYPKQLINMYNQHTMLQNTVLRLKDMADMDAPLIVCNEAHRFMTAEQLHRIQVTHRPSFWSRPPKTRPRPLPWPPSS